MDEKRRQQEERADRIAYLIGIQYDSLTVLYETICDKEYEEAKREIKQFKSASQSSTTRAVKKTAKVGIPLISGGSALAYQQKRNK